MFDAWHLPGLRDDELTLTSYNLAGLQLRAPALTTDQLSRVLHHVQTARARTLLQASMDEIVDAIDAVARRLADRSSAEGAAARTLIPAVTGYSPPVVEDILDHMTHDWRRESLETLILLELGEPSVLDQPAIDPRGRRRTIARGPTFVFEVFAGNVPGVAVTSLIRCLLVRASQLGKTASGEPVLSVLFARALADIHPALAECLAVSYWPGGSIVTEDCALSHADTVIVYGGDEAVSAISARAGVGTRLIVHGPKLSIGIVGRAASIDVAPAIAYAVAAYDQQGCVSPHAVYVERGGKVDAKQLAHAIAASLATLAHSYPRRQVNAAEAMAIRSARTSVEFRAINGSNSEVYASEDTSYTVIYDDDASLQPSCLNRTLYIKPIARAQAISSLLLPHRGIMQSVALAGFSANQAQTLAMLLADCGVTRVTSFKDLPWPPMWWHHDGRGVLRELLTWHDVEAT